MRRARPLVLLLIAGLLVLVGGSYYLQSKITQHGAKPVPPAPPPGVVATAEGWSWKRMAGDMPAVEVQARDFRQIEKPARFELVGVVLKLYAKDGHSYDRVTSERADLDQSNGVMYSEGEVEITKNVKDESAPAGKVLKMKSSGVRYDTRTGKVDTDRAASFTFDRAEGKCTGATYDPTTRELEMRSAVELRVKAEGKDAAAKSMLIQAGNLIYKENEAKVYLSPWSKLVRGTTTLEGGKAVVTLKDQDIDAVEAENARGTDRRPDRNVDYAAAQLVMHFDENREVREVAGDRDARLVSKSENAEMTVTANHVQLAFATGAHESVLERAVASGQTAVESKPVPKKGVPTPETKILRSETVNLEMQPGGQYIKSAQTESPGTLEFVPNRAGQRRRRLEGERFFIAYGEENQIRSFRATSVATRTEPEPRDPKDPKARPNAPPPEPALTWSKELSAEYDDKGQLTRTEQNGDFRYQEGDRQARAAKATLESAKDLITLDGAARVLDPSGSTAADRIVMNQKTDDYSAEGNVNSTRMPDRKKPAKTGAAAQTPAATAPPPAPLLADDQPMQAKAARMTSREKNQKLSYEGSALLWQGANRIRADRIDIDRKEKRLVAAGNVVSQFVDKTDGTEPKDGKKPAPPKNVYTMIKSPDMVYTDKDRLAYYKGGVLLNRPDMQVKSLELRAFLNSEDSDSSLDHAIADGKVDIVQNAPGRVRHGSSEHAEYYVEEERILLTGGDPVFSDSLRGNTRGRQLTYFSADDKLIVDGVEAQPARSRVRRK